MKRKKPELLAPAGNMEKLKMAILYGADAVYLGGEAYGLRAQGGNFSREELAEAARFARERGKKIYVTVNVYPHNAEFAALPDYLRYLQAIGADAILVSSLYGQGELDCRGLREKCDEAGLGGILLYVGGNIVIGKQPFDEVEKRFKAMGFDRSFPPGTPPEVDIAALKEDLHIED